MFTVYEYGGMIHDHVRRESYLEALRRSVRPGDIVLDLGTGVGYFALFAVRFGARHVYAIEPNPAINTAREIAALNGYADRITFIEDFSQNVNLPEAVDLIVSDLRGSTPLFSDHIAVLADARLRFLKPGGAIIPLRDRLRAAAVEAPEVYEPYHRPWMVEAQGFDMSPALRMACNTLRKVRLSPSQSLSEPQCWATLDYMSAERAQVAGEIRSTISRDGVAHGVAGWFDAELVPGFGFSTMPGSGTKVYDSIFLPFLAPVEVSQQDSLAVTLSASPVGDDYVWNWKTCIRDRQSGETKAEFQQSTFFSDSLPSSLPKAAHDYVPSLGVDGEIDRSILALMDGKMPVATIANKVYAGFPSNFRTSHDALTRVGRLSQKYGK